MGDKVTVPFIAALTIVTNLLVWSLPAHAQNKLYDTSQTVTIEGEVAGFVVGDEYATVSIFPVGEPKNSRTMWVIDWRAGTSLSGQGITADWLKSGDRVVVTGHPHRSPDQRSMLLNTITRGSDGRTWAQGQAAAAAPSATGAPQSAPAASTSNTSAGSVSNQDVTTPSNEEWRYISALVETQGLAERRGWSAQQKQWFIECAGREYAARVKAFLALPQVKASGTTTVDVNGEFGQSVVREAFLACQLKVPAAGALAGAKPTAGVAPGAANAAASSTSAPPLTPASGPTPAHVTPSAGPSPVSPPAAAPPATTTPPASEAPPQQTETPGERQNAINEDVSAKTASVVADLKKKADAQVAQAGAAAQAASQAAAQSQAVHTRSAGAPAGPAWEPCRNGLRSGASQTAVPVEFVNSSKEPRKLIWLDFAGGKMVAGILQPGQRAPMQTYTTHVWMIADGSDRCMGTLVISKAGSIEIH